MFAYWCDVWCMLVGLFIFVLFLIYFLPSLFHVKYNKNELRSWCLLWKKRMTLGWMCSLVVFQNWFCHDSLLVIYDNVIDTCWHVFMFWFYPHTYAKDLNFELGVCFCNASATVIISVLSCFCLVVDIFVVIPYYTPIKTC